MDISLPFFPMELWSLSQAWRKQHCFALPSNSCCFCQAICGKGASGCCAVIDVLVFQTRSCKSWCSRIGPHQERKHAGANVLFSASIFQILIFFFVNLFLGYPWWLLAPYFLPLLLFDLLFHTLSELDLGFHFRALLNVLLNLKWAEDQRNCSVQEWRRAQMIKMLIMLFKCNFWKVLGCCFAWDALPLF